MKRPDFNMRGYKGYSFGLHLPVRFAEMQGCGWVVYNVRTGKIYATELASWDAPNRCMQENERLGYGCRPDIAAIDSTP